MYFPMREGQADAARHDVSCGNFLALINLAMTMTISTRPARADDKPAIWRLYEDAMKPHIEEIWGWDAAWQIADFDKGLSTAATYVVEVDDAFAGYVQLNLGAVEDYLRMIVLVPAYRSSGIGARLLAAIVRASRQDGRGLGLRVFPTNPSAKRFYEREGWRVVAYDGHFGLMKPGSVPTFGHGLIDTGLFQIHRDRASGVSAAADL
jgi:GNAT superfamily N-acetyltransferase